MKERLVSIINYYKRSVNLLKLIAFVWGSFYLFKSVLSDLIPYPYGDGLEYVLTTEALYDHLSPDVKAEDIVHLKNETIKSIEWKNMGKSDYIDNTYTFLSRPDKKYMDNYIGFFTALNGKQYSYHFFFYSLINVPVRALTYLFNINPFNTFPLTNSLLILAVCLLIVLRSPFDEYTSLIIAGLFYFSAVHWYITWPHPEVFTACLVFAGLWLYFQEQYYLPMVLIAIAALQNQPLTLLVLFMGLSLLLNKGFSRKNILVISLSVLITLLPSWFYYSHFNIPNLVTQQGFLDSQYITFTRIFGFFFDLNQGVIIAIPLILLIYTVLILKDGWFFLRNKSAFNINLLLPLTVVVMSIVLSTMSNWNHGQSVINRYATWISIIILVHFLFMIRKGSLVTKLLLTICLLTQVYTVIANDGIGAVEWSNYKHKGVAKWFIEHHPEFYNPDPQIFAARTAQRGLDKNSNPVIYWNEKGELCKMMVCIDQIQAFNLPPLSDTQMKKIRYGLKFINGWAYINPNDIYNGLTAAEKKIVKKGFKIQYAEHVIRSNSEWYNSVLKKAEDWHMNIDTLIRMDAKYSVEQGQEEKN